MQFVKAIFFVFTIYFLTSCAWNNPRYTIGVSQCSADSWRDKMNTELQSAAYADGTVKLDIVSANDDSELQKQQIKNFIANNVDLIIVAPNQSGSISSAIDEARAKGIPVICIDRKTDSQNYTAFIGADNYEAGRVVGQYIASRLSGKGVILEVRGLEGSSPATERHRGFVDAVKPFEGITIVDGGATDWTQEGAQKAVSAYLKAKSTQTINAVFGHNDRIVAEARKQLSQTQNNVIYVGVDALPTAEGGLLQVVNGEIEASYLYPTRGDIVMKLAMQVLRGEPFDKETQLTSALITQDNAEVVLTQMDDMQQMQQRIATMNSQIDNFLIQINNQRMLFTMAVIIVLLLIFIVVYVYREQAKKRQRAIAETNERLRFFTNVSHEFRTPLTLIADPLQRISASNELSEASMGMLSMARRQVDVMLQLVNQILDLRKIQNGKMTIRNKNINLSTLIVQWTDGFRLLAEAKGVSIRTLTPQNLQVNTDVQKLERIVYNLLSNALKHAPKGTEVVVNIASEKDCFTLSVADNGAGIPENDQKYIFNRFYQSSSSTGGTGIGLALVQELVVMLNGDISLESKPNHGTTFTVTLPSVGCSTETIEEKVEFVVGEQQESDTETAIITEDNDASLVLIVDDNADVRAYLSELLTTSGYKVLEASNGVEGLNTATEQVPDVVISDVMMPVMDGHELCRQLKSHTITSHIPVLLLTAQTMDDQRMEGYSTGADAYITKPFASKVLLARIQNLLENRRLLKDLFKNSLPPAPSEGGGEPNEALQAQGNEVGHDVSNELNTYTKVYLEGEQDTNNTTAKEIATPPYNNESDIVSPPPSEGLGEAPIDPFLTSFREKVEERMTDSNFSVETLAADLYLSRVQMYRKIKALTGKNPVELIREARLMRADNLLRTGRYTASEVAYKVGFSSPSYFNKCYKELFGHSPKVK